MNPADLSIVEASALLARRQLSPLELTRACLERIEQRNPAVNAFITLAAEEALQAAQQAEAEIAAGRYRGPLHGIPLALKDLFFTAGMPTTAGSRFSFAPEHQAPNAHVVEKLLAAGIILLGKLNMHEIALGVTNVNPHFGDCTNPHAPEHMTGGSSGGSAAALAAGMILGSLGSDTGGSIRIPSALCGTVGLKPTRGRISLRGVIPLSWNLDHVGPMARCVGDVAILLQTIAGYDPADPASVDVPLPDWPAEIEGGVRGWRIALADDAYFTEIDPEVLAATRQAAEVFRELGAVVEPVAFPNARDAALANGIMTQADAAAFHRQRLAEQAGWFGADVRKRLQTGAGFSAVEYSLARRLQAELRQQFRRFFTRYDVLLAPTTPIPAPRRAGDDAVERARQLTRFTAPFNLTGLPALSVPCGRTSSGLPIGLQLVSRPWNEAAVLRAGRSYEQAVA